MSDRPPPSPEDRERASFVALVLMLREFAQGLLAEGQVLEARALIDGLDAVRAKTAGNLRDDEARFLDEVLHELHLAAVKPRPAAPSEGGEGTPGGAGAENP